jgi:hypothetical protein
MGSLPPPTSPLLPPIGDQTVRDVWTDYARALGSLPGTPEERLTTLHGLLADVSGRLQQQTSQSISQALQDYASRQDQPVIRSMTTARPSPPDRPQAREASQPPSPQSLLYASRLGPRLAGKLVMASVRRGR